MKNEWKENTGVQPVADGVKIDVIYLDGEINFNVSAGIIMARDGSFNRSAHNWLLNGLECSIFSWRLHVDEDDDTITEEQAWTLAGDLLNRIKESSKQPQTV